MILKHCVIYMAAIFSLVTQESAAFDFNFQPQGQESHWWGTDRKDVYDVAVLVKAPSLTGKTIQGISVPLAATHITSVSAWISSKLTLKKQNGVTANYPDILSQEAVPENGMLNVTFSSPTVIPAEGIYVGYSFQISSVDEDADKLPLSVYEATNDDGFFIHTRKSYIKWENVSEKLGLVSALNVIIDGSLPSYALSLTPQKEVYAKCGEEVTVNAVVKNHGLEAIGNFTCNYSLGDQQLTMTQHFNQPLPPQFNASIPVSLTLPSITQCGVYEGMLNVTEVNGQPNIESENVGITVYVMDFLPTKTVVMEEYTGTWCGWCPRGTACIEHLSDEFPLNFIGIAYHQDDPMATAATNPTAYSGLPSCSLDRGLATDPGYADIYPQFSMLKDKMPAAFVNVEASFNEQTIDCKSELTFVKSQDNANYRLAYLLVADSLKGEYWYQTNYYANLSATEKERWLETDPYIEPYINGEEMMLRPYNHVMVYSSDTKGIVGSVPPTIEGNTSVTHRHTIDKTLVVNKSGESLLQEQASYHIVALLVDGATGKVVNAARCEVAGMGNNPAEAIDGPLATEGTHPIYYNLQGRVCNPSQPGIYKGDERKGF